MLRTFINLDPDDKHWLDREARRWRVPMAELLRRAIRGYRLREESRAKKPMLQAAIGRTAGIWRQGDGFNWQQRVRDEWDRLA